jgi:hypothetical protein
MFLMSLTNIMEVHFNKLETIETPVQDEVKITILLISLFGNYHNLITTMESLWPMDQTWDVVNTKLLNEKLMRKGKENLIKAEKL